MIRNIVNLTPHPIRLYAPDTPDRIDDVLTGLACTIEPSGTVARLAEAMVGDPRVDGFETYSSGVAPIPIATVQWSAVEGLPEAAAGVYLVVPLLTALAAKERDDLLVPYQQVRNAEGTVVGCRSLARPV